MGNCISKFYFEKTFDEYIDLVDKGGIRRGVKAEFYSRSVGCHAYEVNDILTPVSDRFPAQACELEVKREYGYKFKKRVSKKFMRDCPLFKKIHRRNLLREVYYKMNFIYLFFEIYKKTVHFLKKILYL